MIIVGVILIALILIASVAVVMMSNTGNNGSNSNNNGDGNNENADTNSSNDGTGDGDGDNGDSSQLTGNWVDLSNVLPYASYSDVYAIGNEVWITSGSSTELYYNDAAGTTDFVTYSTPDELLCIHMLNSNEGYAGAQNGRVFRTTNGGVNWTLLLPPTGASVTSITFPPTADTGYCCGEVGGIYSVTSTGTTKMTSNVVSNMASICFPTSDEGWVVGEDVIRHYTSASGQWNADQSYPGSITCTAVYFIDNNNGWIVGGTGSNGAIIHTTDGINWASQTDPNPSKGFLEAVFFLDDGLTGWAAGNFGRVLSTTDGGNTWNIENTGASMDLLRSVHFTSYTNGYIVGNSGNAYKFVGDE